MLVPITTLRPVPIAALHLVPIQRYHHSIGQWYDIIENFGHVKILADGNFNDMKRAQRNLDEKIGLAPTMYWSSSPKSFRGAWVAVLRAGNINSYDKNYACLIRAVAAF